MALENLLIKVTSLMARLVIAIYVIIIEVPLPLLPGRYTSPKNNIKYRSKKLKIL